MGSILGGIKQYKAMMILRDFPYNSALFGLMTPVVPIASLSFHTVLKVSF